MTIRLVQRDIVEGDIVGPGSPKVITLGETVDPNKCLILTSVAMPGGFARNFWHFWPVFGEFNSGSEIQLTRRNLSQNIVTYAAVQVVEFDDATQKETGEFLAEYANDINSGVQTYNLTNTFDPAHTLLTWAFCGEDGGTTAE